MPSEFDNYAKNYEELLRDPIRDRFASEGLFFMRRKWELLQDFFSRRRAPMKQLRWLDVGCGCGDLLRLGREAFGSVAGCDVSSEMLAAAQDLEVSVQPDPGVLPYDAETIDLATAVCVYHHVLTEPLRANLTAELCRVLRPGGIACIIEHNPFNPVTQMIVRRTPVDADAQLLRAGQARRLLRAGGLQVIGKQYFLFFPEKLYRKAGALESALSWVPLGGQYAVFAEKRA